jgi:hypothetical protein
MIQEITKAFAKISKIDPDSESYKKLIKILDDSSDQTLKQLANAKIKFISPLAFNRCVRRGIKV